MNKDIEVRPHHLASTTSWMMLAAGIGLLMLAGGGYVFDSIHDYPTAADITFLQYVAVAGVIVSAWGWIKIKEHASIKYTIRKHDILAESGCLSRRQRSIPFRSIRFVRCVQPAADRLAGIGDVFLDSVGGRGGEIVLHAITDPQKIADEIRARMNGNGKPL